MYVRQTAFGPAFDAFALTRKQARAARRARARARFVRVWSTRIGAFRATYGRTIMSHAIATYVGGLVAAVVTFALFVTTGR